MYRLATSNSHSVFTHATKFFVIFIFFILPVLVVAGCGGSKKVVQTETEQPEPVEVSQPEPEPVETAPREEVKVEESAPPEPLILSTIYFDFDKYDLRPEALQTLAMNAQGLKSHPEATVIIEGHCDERGTVEYNLALGDKRAKAAREYLVSLGVAPAQLSTISYGKERPVDSRHNEEAWAKNRRAEFVKR